MVNLEKGQRINLSKENSVDKIKVGLKWMPKGASENVSQGNGGGLLKAIGGLLGGRSSPGQSSGYEYDVDASILMLSADNKLISTVYYGKKTSPDGSIVHMGDDRTGSDIQGDDGDNENINVVLSKVDPRVDSLLFVANIYQGPSRSQDFSMIAGARIKVTNMGTKQEIATYTLSGRKGINAAIIGRMYRRPNNSWNFEAIGEELTLRSGVVSEITSKYQ